MTSITEKNTGASRAMRHVLVLGTGGTIAGCRREGAAQGYVAGQVGIAALLGELQGQLPGELPGELTGGEPGGRPPAALAGLRLSAQQIAQIDSKDMAWPLWRVLAQRCMQALADDAVDGIVITHGSDTLEETAFFLHSVLDARKPIVLTCAMRPADAPAPDGPQNLRDAIIAAAAPGARGVLAACAGRLHGAVEISKVHPWRLDPFSSGDAGAIAYVHAGALRRVRAWPASAVRCPWTRIEQAAALPRVEIICSHADAGGHLIDLLVRERERLCGTGGPAGTPAAHAVDGLVIAATGNGTVHQSIEAAIGRARAAGIAVLRATRCGEAGIAGPRTGQGAQADACDGRCASELSPVKARIALALDLLAAGPGNPENGGS
ncbi:MAG: asparaginase [Burkholderiaceae bacterium]|jgi:L-asparaginase|nr:asparaginase [Burkholderiaceae bacterium]